MLSAENFMTPRSKNGGANLSPRRSATIAGLPHRGGGAAPGGGGGELRPTNANIRPMKCSGGQSRERDAATRLQHAPHLGHYDIGAWREHVAQWPNWLTTTSNDASG
jgi:hypothetical protein